MAALAFFATTAASPPPPLIPEDNPATRAKIELGRRLFYDTRLSVTGVYSCGSCHMPARAFTDGRAVGIGATGEANARNVPSLANVVYRPVLTWADPKLRRLEDQLLVPLLGTHPVELGGREDKILTVMAEDATYRGLFVQSFAGEITLANVAKAIATFERTLISFDSPWDRYRDGDNGAISPEAKRGEALFFSERTQCFRCHPAPHFTDSYKSADLPYEEIAFHDIGLDVPDTTRARAPSLRNVAVTAPYMHDGSLATLADVIDLYAAGGRAAARGRPSKSTYIRRFVLSDAEKRELIAFLESLTDTGFLNDRRFSDPFAR